MKKLSETIIFFGSGPVAAKSLELLAENFNIEAVITKPKPAHHKGNFPVLDIAKRLNLPVLTVADRQSLGQLIQTEPVKSRLGVLIDFGIIVSQSVIDYFPLGIINSHFSVLPEWRGADPISFVILSGQKVTGVSLMKLVKAMDEGPLIAYGELALNGNETSAELTEQLIYLSDGLLSDRLPDYIENRSTFNQQTTGREVSYSRKLNKADGLIDWHKPATQLEREVRAFLEWPKSRSQLASKDIIITRAHASLESKFRSRASREIGLTCVTPDKQLAVQTSQGLLIIDKLKPAGKPEMTARDFIAGYGRQI
ncbi:MAG: methionyl-tRNA formyltransferase [Candidatus Saccharimonadales bacterium]